MCPKVPSYAGVRVKGVLTTFKLFCGDKFEKRVPGENHQLVYFFTQRYI
jgi:hypothetical protein